MFFIHFLMNVEYLDIHTNSTCIVLYCIVCLLTVPLRNKIIANTVQNHKNTKYNNKQNKIS